MAFTDILAQLAVSLDLDSGGFVRKSVEAGKSADQMGKKIEGAGSKVGSAGGQFRSFATGVAGAFAALGAGAVVQAAGNAIKSASALGSMAQQLGVTASELQKFRIAGKQLGVDQGNIDDAIRTLTQTVGKAAQGSKSAFAVFDQLGIQIRDAAGNIRPTGALLTEIAGKLERIPDPATRAALSVQLFGEEGQRIAPLLNQGADGIKRMGDEAERTGKIISDADIARAQEMQRKFDDIATTLQTRFTTAVVRGAAEISGLDGKLSTMSASVQAFDAQLGIPPPTALWDSIKKNSAESAARLDAFAANVAANMRSLGQELSAVGSGFASMASQAIGAVQRLASGVTEYLTGRLNAAFASVKQKAKEVGDAFYQLWDRVVGHSYVPDMVEGVGFEFGRLGALMVRPAALATGEVADEFETLTVTAEDKTARMIDAFGQMAAGVVGSLKDMVASFKSGDILGGIQSILDLVLNVSQALVGMGVIKVKGGISETGAIPGRARGGPVVPGRTYMVGENGPEFITPKRSGYVHANGKGPGAGVAVQVVPSPYFDVVVDGRAQRVAAPMAGHAAIGGAIGAQQSLARRQRHALR